MNLVVLHQCFSHDPLFQEIVDAIAFGVVVTGTCSELAGECLRSGAYSSFAVAKDQVG